MLQITINGGIAFGPSWDDLQRLVVGMLNTPGVFTRIARRDNGANYRANYGVYDVTFIPETSGDVVEIELTVNRSVR
jgi:hypothetical protein